MLKSNSFGSDDGGGSHKAKHTKNGDVYAFGRLAHWFHSRTGSHSPNICHVHYGYNFVIYADANYEEMFAAGLNVCGQWGIGGRTHYDWSNKPVPIKNHELQITRMFTSNCSESVFWKTDDGELYGMGRNNFGQLGNGGTDDTFYPDRIDIGHRVSDIQCADDFSIALCGVTQRDLLLLIHHLFRGVHIPLQLIQGVIAYFGSGSTVHRTGLAPFAIGSWKQLPVFDTKNIQQIACGEDFAVFLDAQGALWGMQSGKDPHIEIVGPFTGNQVRITRIAAGQGHILALDDQYRVWSWGRNDCGQCGHDEKESGPAVIASMSGRRVEDIGCGKRSSYCRTVEGKYYVFGSDHEGQLMGLGQWDLRKQQRIVKKPICINEVIAHLYRKNIQSITLGFGMAIRTVD